MQLLILIIAGLMHEAGHYTVAYILRTSPVLVYGYFYAGIETDRANTRFSQKILIIFAGVVLGSLPLLLSNDLHVLIYIIYVILCITDIIALLSCTYCMRKYGDITIGEWRTKNQMSENDKKA